ncbi:MAG: cytochrome b/b6 domain-containing protein [Candidatus Thiodiazotropha sp. (ex Lucina aurantia)]|nr:cytochrome b/b6 domain-containing protein [Candidatus Thiodiazotropha sp. (ex Lucina pensylvanica)]MBT3015423.1 cytochrome b/b6 domain-containing protein [Candidatus Thiodiazotropha taylori]MBT3052363.1 cytochrome b/b6 domain-containing protein [Candidatus Thiodiazotropha sp. (ex Codakia orbicularis)]MBV2102061.1 cytochrome b/b6 domain-containing protein [Candidatus Thiodiazotropha sp. (ex Lucina aurantia)]MCG7862457.1 cytochrome b/b6 domain-containing protein [Candidatus Thiodiazotropha end
MQVTNVSRVLVWSGRLRLAHWSLGISSIGLLLTGWLMNNTPLMAQSAAEIHFMLSGLFLPALLLRIYLLLFGKGSEHLSSCEPNLHRLSQAWLVLKFYLTLGKAPLPKWYSHNPLWGPVYLVLYFFMLLVAVSGLFLLKAISMIGGLSLNDLHYLSYQVIATFTLLHIIAVFSHDLAGKGSDISGMINGQRTFEIDNPRHDDNNRTQSIALGELMKSLKR